MDWNEFLLWLQLITSNYCAKEAPKDKSNCIELVRECVLDGEEFNWCMDNWNKND